MQRAFAPLIGLPAWFVHKGHGSFLTMEFGEPHLHVREPVASHPESAQVRAAMARRIVRPEGDWHLWIYCCFWRVLAEGTEIAWSESSDEQIDAAARKIDGQLLTSVAVDPTTGKSAFTFDLRSALHTWPAEDARSDEQWMLYARKSGDVFSYRGDGCYSLGPGTLKPTDMVWQPLRSGSNT